MITGRLGFVLEIKFKKRRHSEKKNDEKNVKEM